MDQSWFLFLNRVPASVPAIGAIAVAVFKYGPVFYAAVLVWLWARGMGTTEAMQARRRRLLLAVLAAALSLAVNLVFNAAIPRPFLVLPAHVLGGPPPHDPSFPSDHAAFSAAIATTLLLGGMAGWGAAGLLGSFVLGASRIIVGVHFPSDVHGGFVVGAACGAAVSAAEDRLRPALDLLLGVARRLRLA